jgi:hypothetical protein
MIAIKASAEASTERPTAFAGYSQRVRCGNDSGDHNCSQQSTHHQTPNNIGRSDDCDAWAAKMRMRIARCHGQIYHVGALIAPQAFRKGISQPAHRHPRADRSPASAVIANGAANWLDEGEGPAFARRPSGRFADFSEIGVHTCLRLKLVRRRGGPGSKAWDKGGKLVNLTLCLKPWFDQ